MHSEKISPKRKVLEREILFLQILDHPNIFGFVDAFITDSIPKQVGLYMEYCEFGTAHEFIGRYLRTKEEPFWKFGRQKLSPSPLSGTYSIP